MKKYILFIGLLAITHVSHSQQPWKFSSQNSIGLLEGNGGSAFQFQTVNGWSNKRLFGGVGTGLDYYYTRSIPLFFSLQSNLTKKERTPFIALDAGVNFAWHKRVQSRWDDFISSDYKPGLYFSSGFGYKIGLKNKKDALLLSVGYSRKQLTEVQTQPVFCIMPPCPPSTETYRYTFNRLLVRFGWQL